MCAHNDTSGEQELLEKESSDRVACGQDGFVRNASDKKLRERFSLVCAFACAWEGIVYAFKTQRNMKIHVLVAVVAIALGFFFSIDAPSWAVIILCIVMVVASECINTALESVVDLVSPEYSTLAKYAKDCAAGSVLLCALGAVVVAAIIFLPRIGALIF